MAKKKAPVCATCRFPTFGIILLLIGIVWLLADMGYITFNVPWWPLILIVVAIGMIFNKLKQ